VCRALYFLSLATPLPAPFRDTNPFIDRLSFHLCVHDHFASRRFVHTISPMATPPRFHGILGTAIEKINGTIMNHRLSLLDMTSCEDVGGCGRNLDMNTSHAREMNHLRSQVYSHVLPTYNSITEKTSDYQQPRNSREQRPDRSIRLRQNTLENAHSLCIYRNSSPMPT